MSDKVIYFSASWCAPCRAITPHFQAMSQEFPDVKFQKVDIDEEISLTSEYQVRAVPTLVHLKDGQEIARVVGVRSKEDLIRDLSL